MKKITLFVVALMMSVAANAQFEKGKTYIEASLSSLDLSSQAKKFHFGAKARMGYLFTDNLMALGEIGYNHLQDADDTFNLGAGARYYIVQNGLYMGAMLKYQHASGYNDFLPSVHVGYAFFLSRTVTVEPELYLDISTKSSDYTNYGLGVGFGIYL